MFPQICRAAPAGQAGPVPLPRRALVVQQPAAALSISLQQVAGFAKAAGQSGGGAGKTNRLLKILEPQQTAKVVRTPEELKDAAERSKEYSRKRMAQHRAWQADLSAKLQLKHAALAALPTRLQAAASAPDNALFPLNRNVWQETPPVEVKTTKAAAHTSRTRNIGTKRQ